MTAKDILFASTARARVGAGLDALANAVKVTLGPRGRNVVIDRSGGAPTITKDGVTVAKEIELEDRFANLGAQMVKEVASKTSDSASDYDREKLQERLAKLVGGVVVIRVGAATEVEMKEKKARVEDAMHATRAAVEEGVVAGGGVALLRCTLPLATMVFHDDRRYGVSIVRRALEEPLRQIAQNSGAEGAVVVSKVRAGKAGYGYNAATDHYEDLIAAGVIDPTKVVRVALQNAASVASLMLTTEALIAEHTPASTERAPS